MSKSNTARSVVTSSQTDDAVTRSKPDYIPESIVQCKGFINCITEIPRGGGHDVEESDADSLFFARLAIITGRELHASKYRDRMQFVNVMIGSKLRRLAANAVENARLEITNAKSASTETPGFAFKDILCHFVIHDLHFSLLEDDQADGRTKTYLKTRGVLAELSFH